MINIRALLRGLFTSASSKACDEEITDPQPLKLFVSHSTADAPLAEALVELFRSALNLPAEAIRCTSVEGYRLPGGANVDEQLRSEVNSAKACVGIISRQSIQSPYVLLELGARWGPKLHLLPVLAPGNGPEVLDGPLAGLHALTIDQKSLHQLVEDLGKTLGLDLTTATTYQGQIDRVLAIPAEAPPGTTHEGIHVRTPYPNQRELPNTPASKSGEVPVEALKQSPMRTVITVRSAAGSLLGADLLILFPNKTWKLATTDTHGEATVDSHATHLPMTVFAAAKGYAAHVEREWVPSQRALAIELEPLPDGGAVIFPEATGHVPGVTGRLNPKRDTHDRTYLYASNIAINEGQQQPVHFDTGEEMRLTDAEGRERLVRIVEVIGRAALVEYKSR